MYFISIFFPHTSRFRFRLPVFAPFGTEGFTLSPEEERKKDKRDEDRKERDRKKKGVEKDGF